MKNYITILFLLLSIFLGSSSVFAGGADDQERQRKEAAQHAAWLEKKKNIKKGAEYLADSARENMKEVFRVATSKKTKKVINEISAFIIFDIALAPLTGGEVGDNASSPPKSAMQTVAETAVLRTAPPLMAGKPLLNRLSPYLAKAPSIKVLIDENKFNYIFGKVSSSSHNAARSNQLALTMKNLGISDDKTGRYLLNQHFKSLISGGNKNLVESFSNKYGKFEVRESILYGPSGKSVKLKTTFQILDDGTRYFTTVIPTGKASNFKANQ